MSARSTNEPSKQSHPEFGSYWRLLRQVLAYGVDQHRNYELSVPGASLPPITEESFLRNLYLPLRGLDYEQQLADTLNISGKLMVVTAGRGAGKSSLLRSVAARLAAQPHPSPHLTLLDFRRLWDARALWSLEDDSARRDIASLLEVEIRSRLFPTVGDTRRLVAWLVAGAPEKSDDFDASSLAIFHDLSMQTLLRVETDAESRAERYEAVLEWLQSKDRFLKLMEAVVPRLSLSHSLLAKRSLDGLEKFILVYDNVDKLPTNHQALLLEVANDNQLATSGFVTTCISLRTENLTSWEGSEKGVSWLESIASDSRLYAGTHLPPVTTDGFTSVIERRVDFSRLLLKEALPEFGLDSWWTDSHSAALEVFAGVHMEQIANDDLRLITRLYAGFISYLGTLREMSPRLVSDPVYGGFLRTLFFLWLRADDSVPTLRLADVAPPKGDETTRVPISSLCLSHHLLAAVLNATHQRRLQRESNEHPRYGFLLKQMTQLGFSQEEVSRHVFEMEAPDSSGALLEILRKRPGSGLARPLPEDRVRLTALGKVLLVELLPKVGYTWALALESLGSLPLDSSVSRYLELPSEARLEILQGYLSKLARWQLSTVEMIGRNGVYEGDDWLALYRSRFGVMGQLPAERALDEARKFFGRSYKARNEFDVLLAKLTAGLEELSSGRRLSERIQ